MKVRSRVAGSSEPIAPPKGRPRKTKSGEAPTPHLKVNVHKPRGQPSTGGDSGARISSATLRATETLAGRLREKGYAPAIAMRLAAQAPKLAKRILRAPVDRGWKRMVRVHEPVELMNFGPMDGRPVRLYRGLCLPEAKLNTTFADTRIPGLAFFSESITEPHKYASGEALGQRAEALARGDVTGTVVEIEVPSFFVYYYGHPVLRSADVPDVGLFLSRFAPVDLRQPYFPKLDADELTFAPWEPGNIQAPTAPPAPPAPAPLSPARRADVVTIDPSFGYKEVSDSVTLGDGSTWVAFDTTLAVTFTRTTDGRTFGPLTKLAPATSAPSFVHSQGVDYLYALAGFGQRRYAFPPRPGDPGEPVTGLPTGTPEAPRFTALADGRVAACYRDTLHRAVLQFSRDGRMFGPPLVLDARRTAIPSLNQCSDGTLAFAFQVMQPDQSFLSYLRLSRDGASWSQPILVTASSNNVHDQCLVRRADGGIDTYYIYPAPEGQGFSLYRRSCSSGGNLGPEERVTAADVGSVMKPEVVRMRDGSLLVSFATAVGMTPEGFPASEHREAIRIPRDAPGA